MAKDDRLERLFDYTKWHLGIYIGATGGLLAISAHPGPFVEGLFLHEHLLKVSACLMGLAGFSGGMVASGCTQVQSFDDIWLQRQGPFGWKWMKGKYWARLEHAAFWLSAIVAGMAVMLKGIIS